jgi:hypothetical protein
VEASRQRAQAAESSGHKHAHGSVVHRHGQPGATAADDDDNAINSHATKHVSAIATEWDGDPGKRSYACRHCLYHYTYKRSYACRHCTFR